VSGGAGPYVIGCDVGSQGTNCALYAADGRLVASSYQAYDLSFPFPGAAEQDPELWPAAVAAGVRDLLERVPEGSPAVKGLSFGSQLDGMVVCGTDGRPLRPAMIWMDRRAESQAARVAETIAPDEFYGHVGANLDSSHAIFKALWVRDEEPDLWSKTAFLMSPGTYVLKAVAAAVAIDYSNASSFALLDPRSRKWSAEVLSAVDVPENLLPEVVPATEPIATISSSFAEATGLDPGTVVAVGCGDEMAATLGAGVYAPGEVCDVVGTAEPVCAASAEPREDPTMLVECHPHADPDAWLLENPGFVSGGSLRWWRDQFGAVEREAEARGEGDAYDLLSAAARQIPPGSAGVVFLPCLQGAMAPEWNGAARGVFFGLTLAHTRAHMTRAILEGSAFALRDILEAMTAAGLGVDRLTIVGGGAKSALWRQIKADVTGLPVRVPTSVETTATGAAVLAAVASGVHASVADSVAAFVAFEPEETTPDPERHRAYDESYRRYRDVYFAMKPVFDGA
jgi:xylulokinase